MHDAQAYTAPAARRTAPLDGIWLPLVTPFRHGRLDTEVLHRLTASYLDTGIAGFVALGTTGEAALLDHTERRDALATILDAAAGRLPVWVGIGGIDTRDFLARIDDLERSGVAGYLVSPPAYLCPDQAGVRWHFGQIAERTARPLMLYDVPHRTGVSIEPGTVRELIRQYPHVVAIKACVAARFDALGALPIALLSGTDASFLDCLAAGGTGGVLASAHVGADLFVEVQRLFGAGRVTEARALSAALQPPIRALFAAPNPAAIKAMLSLTHDLTTEVRMPITPASPQLVSELRRMQATLDALRGEWLGVTT